MNMTERDYYRDRMVPEADRMHWRVKLSGADAEYAIRLGTGGHDTLIEKNSLEGADYQTLAHDTRAVAVLRVPASELGQEFFERGDVIELNSILESHARAERIDWQGKFTLD